MSSKARFTKGATTRRTCAWTFAGLIRQLSPTPGRPKSSLRKANHSQGSEGSVTTPPQTYPAQQSSSRSKADLKAVTAKRVFLSRGTRWPHLRIHEVMMKRPEQIRLLN